MSKPPGAAHAEPKLKCRREGREGGMRSYNTYVNSTDIANLTAYLRSIGTADEPKLKDWGLPIPPK